MERDIQTIRKAATRIMDAATRVIWARRDRGGGEDSRAFKMSELAEQIDQLSDEWLAVHTSESPEPQTMIDYKRVHRLIQAAGAVGLPKSDLIRKTQDMTATERQAAIEALLSDETVAAAEVTTRTRPRIVYRSRFLE